MDSLLTTAAAAAAAAAVTALLCERAAAHTRARAAAHWRAEAAQHSARRMDPNLPIDAAGRVYHLQVTREELAPRILSVGDVGRAERIAALLDAPVTRTISSRGFVTHTGFFRGVRVSIIATGMGTSMMDFVVREARAMLDGPMAVLRLGTCGGLAASPAGAIAVASHGAVHIRRDPDMARAAVGTHASPHSGAASGACGGPLVAATPSSPYAVSQVVPPHAGLAAAYAAALAKHVTGTLGAAHPVVEGINATAQGFYDTQGRSLTAFPLDRNEQLLGALERALPGVVSLEMETYTLLELADASSPDLPIAACGAAMVVWNRHTKQSIDHSQLPQLEVLGGRAALETLAAFSLESLARSA